MKFLLQIKRVRKLLHEDRKKQAQTASFKSSFQLRENALRDGRFSCTWEDRLPCLSDATQTTSFDAHYVYHTAWAARMLAKNRPTHHVDIGSCLRFATLVSAFIPFEFYDYRPATVTLSDLKSHHADLLQLPFGDNSLPSLSCMHVVEHIGLERYGDPFDPKGDLKAMGELSRVLARGGCLLFVVPIGGEARIQYNAHRIYTYQMITNYFDKLTLCSFSLITDCGCYIENATDEDTMRQKYGCGCFVFIKK